MNRMQQRQVLGLSIFLALVVGFLSFKFISSQPQNIGRGITIETPTKDSAYLDSPRPLEKPKPAPTTSAKSSENPTAPLEDEIVVHVAGAVKNPGVYSLKPGARKIDALKAAGGATDKANTDGVNLAERVSDGIQLYIPNRQEHPDGGAVQTNDEAEPSTPTPIVPLLGAKTAKKESNANAPTKTKAASPPRGATSRTAKKSEKLTDPREGLININTASAEELQRLPGVGPSTAAKIIAYRNEVGGFKAPQDLMEVSGIGEKKFANMQAFIKVR